MGIKKIYFLFPSETFPASVGFCKRFLGEAQRTLGEGDSRGKPFMAHSPLSRAQEDTF